MPTPDTKETPQVDALRAMQDVFTNDEIKRLAEACKEAQENMFAEVIIKYEHGSPHFIIAKSEVYRRVRS